MTVENSNDISTYQLPIGWSRDKAINMGMPHLKGTPCIVCGKSECEQGHFSNHHVTPKGMGGRDETMTIRYEPTGETFKVKSAEVGVCGSGITGCHNGLHGGSWIRLTWVWDDEQKSSEWLSGLLLSQGLQPHSEELWQWGHYEVFEKKREQGKVYERLIVDVRRIHKTIYQWLELLEQTGRSEWVQVR